mgnify:CR=1 FL=1
MMSFKKTAVSMMLASLGLSAMAAPEPILEWDDILANHGPFASIPVHWSDLVVSENGQYLLFANVVHDNGVTAEKLWYFMDLASGEKIDLAASYPSLGSPKTMSASGRYVYSDSAILNVKTGQATTDFSAIANMDATTPLTNHADNTTSMVSHNGRYVAYGHYTFDQDGCQTRNGYVLDLVSNTTTLATPRMGTTDERVCADNQTVTEGLLSGDGQRFFWGTDGTESEINNRWGFGSPTTRDLFAHDWMTASTTNTRVSNCDGCGDSSASADTTSGSHAYEYDVSGNGQFAVFHSFNDYGFGQNFTGRSVYLRNLATQEIELISPPFAGLSMAGTYRGPSISDDGRFVTYRKDGGGAYVHDRWAKDSLEVAESAEAVRISGDGKMIIVVNGDGLYRLANPLLAVTTDFASNVLFVSLPNSESNWTDFDYMSLTNDHTWVGYLNFDGQNGDGFKFDVGGVWDSNGDLVTSANWSENYGDNNSDGIADANGANIVPTQGAGRYKISYYDDTKNYAVEKLVDVTFSCQNATTVVGQSVYVVGNIVELGTWMPANAIKLEPTAYPTWTGSVSIPSNVNVEWKCVKRDEMDASLSQQWQAGANNTFNASSNSSVSASF